MKIRIKNSNLSYTKRVLVDDEAVTLFANQDLGTPYFINGYKVKSNLSIGDTMGSVVESSSYTYYDLYIDNDVRRISVTMSVRNNTTVGSSIFAVNSNDEVVAFIDDNDDSVTGQEEVNSQKTLQLTLPVGVTKCRITKYGTSSRESMYVLTREH